MPAPCYYYNRLYLKQMLTKTFFAALHFLLLCSFITASAQNANSDTTKPVSQKKITLGKDTLISPSDQTFYISGITVVNALWDTTQLGFVQLGSFNRKALAVPDKNMGVYLQDYVNNAFGNLYQAGHPTILWVIQDLRVGERTVGMTERAFIHLKATAYVAVSGAAYKELKAISIEHFNSGWDVTHKHPNNIASAFKELYLNTIAAIDTIGANAPVLSYDAIVAGFLSKRELPAIKDAVMKEGVYLSFASLLQNKPDIEKYKVQGKKVYALTEGDKKEKVAEFWGIVKDGVVYKFKKPGGFIELSRKGYGYVLASYVADYAQAQTRQLIGSAVTGASGGALMYSQGELPLAEEFPKMLYKPEATAIDMATGTLIF
jgi:hypothetical protein